MNNWISRAEEARLVKMCGDNNQAPTKTLTVEKHAMV